MKNRWGKSVSAIVIIALIFTQGVPAGWSDPPQQLTQQAGPGQFIPVVPPGQVPQAELPAEPGTPLAQGIEQGSPLVRDEDLSNLQEVNFGTSEQRQELIQEAQNEVRKFLNVGADVDIPFEKFNTGFDHINFQPGQDRPEIPPYGSGPSTVQLRYGNQVFSVQTGDKLLLTQITTEDDQGHQTDTQSFYYDGQGNKNGESKTVFDPLTGNTLNSTSTWYYPDGSKSYTQETKNIYDGNNLLYSMSNYTNYSSDGIQTYSNETITQNTYNSSGNKTYSLTSSFANGSLNYNSESHYFFDERGHDLGYTTTSTYYAPITGIVTSTYLQTNQKKYDATGHLLSDETTNENTYGTQSYKYRTLKTYSYDYDGQLIEERAENFQNGVLVWGSSVHTLAYDEFGNILHEENKRIQPDGTEVTTDVIDNTYDPETLLLISTVHTWYDTWQQPGVVNAIETTTWIYDDDGNPQEKTTDYAYYWNGTQNSRYVKTRTYNPDGRLTSYHTASYYLDQSGEMVPYWEMQYDYEYDLGTGNLLTITYTQKSQGRLTYSLIETYDPQVSPYSAPDPENYNYENMNYIYLSTGNNYRRYPYRYEEDSRYAGGITWKQGLVGSEEKSYNGPDGTLSSTNLWRFVLKNGEPVSAAYRVTDYRSDGSVTSQSTDRYQVDLEGGQPNYKRAFLRHLFHRQLTFDGNTRTNLISQMFYYNSDGLISVISTVIVNTQGTIHMVDHYQFDLNTGRQLSVMRTVRDDAGKLVLQAQYIVHYSQIQNTCWDCEWYGYDPVPMSQRAEAASVNEMMPIDRWAPYPSSGIESLTVIAKTFNADGTVSNAMNVTFVYTSGWEKPQAPKPRSPIAYENQLSVESVSAQAEMIMPAYWGGYGTIVSVTGNFFSLKRGYNVKIDSNLGYIDPAQMSLAALIALMEQKADETIIQEVRVNIAAGLENNFGMTQEQAQYFALNFTTVDLDKHQATVSLNGAEGILPNPFNGQAPDVNILANFFGSGAPNEVVFNWSATSESTPCIVLPCQATAFQLVSGEFDLGTKQEQEHFKFYFYPNAIDKNGNENSQTQFAGGSHIQSVVVTTGKLRTPIRTLTFDYSADQLTAVHINYLIDHAQDVFGPSGQVGGLDIDVFQFNGQNYPQHVTVRSGTGAVLFQGEFLYRVWMTARPVRMIMCPEGSQDCKPQEELWVPPPPVIELDGIILRDKNGIEFGRIDGFHISPIVTNQPLPLPPTFFATFTLAGQPAIEAEFKISDWQDLFLQIPGMRTQLTDATQRVQQNLLFNFGFNSEDVKKISIHFDLTDLNSLTAQVHLDGSLFEGVGVKPALVGLMFDPALGFIQAIVADEKRGVTLNYKFAPNPEAGFLALIPDTWSLTAGNLLIEGAVRSNTIRIFEDRSATTVCTGVAGEGEMEARCGFPLLATIKMSPVAATRGVEIFYASGAITKAEFKVDQMADGRFYITTAAFRNQENVFVHYRFNYDVTRTNVVCIQAPCPESSRVNLVSVEGTNVQGVHLFTITNIETNFENGGFLAKLQLSSGTVPIAADSLDKLLRLAFIEEALNHRYPGGHQVIFLPQGFALALDEKGNVLDVFQADRSIFGALDDARNALAALGVPEDPTTLGKVQAAEKILSDAIASIKTIIQTVRGVFPQDLSISADQISAFEQHANMQIGQLAAIVNQTRNASHYLVNGVSVDINLLSQRMFEPILEMMIQQWGGISIDGFVDILGYYRQYYPFLTSDITSGLRSYRMIDDAQKLPLNLFLSLVTTGPFFVEDQWYSGSYNDLGEGAKLIVLAVTKYFDEMVVEQTDPVTGQTTLVLDTDRFIEVLRFGPISTRMIPEVRGTLMARFGFTAQQLDDFIERKLIRIEVTPRNLSAKVTIDSSLLAPSSVSNVTLPFDPLHTLNFPANLEINFQLRTQINEGAAPSFPVNNWEFRIPQGAGNLVVNGNQEGLVRFLNEVCPVAGHPAGEGECALTPFQEIRFGADGLITIQDLINHWQADVITHLFGDGRSYITGVTFNQNGHIVKYQFTYEVGISIPLCVAGSGPCGGRQITVRLGDIHATDVDGTALFDIRGIRTEGGKVKASVVLPGGKTFELEAKNLEEFLSPAHIREGIQTALLAQTDAAIQSIQNQITTLQQQLAAKEIEWQIVEAGINELVGILNQTTAALGNLISQGANPDTIQPFLADTQAFLAVGGGLDILKNNYHGYLTGVLIAQIGVLKEYISDLNDYKDQVSAASLEDLLGLAINFPQQRHHIAQTMQVFYPPTRDVSNYIQRGNDLIVQGVTAIATKNLSEVLGLTTEESAQIVSTYANIPLPGSNNVPKSNELGNLAQEVKVLPGRGGDFQLTLAFGGMLFDFQVLLSQGQYQINFTPAATALLTVIKRLKNEGFSLDQIQFVSISGPGLGGEKIQKRLLIGEQVPVPVTWYNVVFQIPGNGHRFEFNVDLGLENKPGQYPNAQVQTQEYDADNRLIHRVEFDGFGTVYSYSLTDPTKLDHVVYVFQDGTRRQLDFSDITDFETFVPGSSQDDSVRAVLRFIMTNGEPLHGRLSLHFSQEEGEMPQGICTKTSPEYSCVGQHNFRWRVESLMEFYELQASSNIHYGAQGVLSVAFDTTTLRAGELLHRIPFGTDGRVVAQRDRATGNLSVIQTNRGRRTMSFQITSYLQRSRNRLRVQRFGDNQFVTFHSDGTIDGL